MLHESTKQKVRKAANAVGWTVAEEKVFKNIDVFIFSKKDKNGILTVKVEQNNVCGNLLNLLLQGNCSPQKREEVYRLFKSIESAFLGGVEL